MICSFSIELFTWDYHMTFSISRQSYTPWNKKMARRISFGLCVQSIYIPFFLLILAYLSAFSVCLRRFQNILPPRLFDQIQRCFQPMKIEENNAPQLLEVSELDLFVEKTWTQKIRYVRKLSGWEGLIPMWKKWYVDGYVVYGLSRAIIYLKLI